LPREVVFIVMGGGSFVRHALAPVVFGSHSSCSQKVTQ
jgi:hypothetical protein